VEEAREIMGLWDQLVAGVALSEADRSLLAGCFERAEEEFEERIDQLREARDVFRALRAVAPMDT
jgi:hypothetical protein